VKGFDMRVLLATLLITIYSSANAQLIVDTGINVTEPGNIVAGFIGPEYQNPCANPEHASCYTASAGRFSVADETTITRIESYFVGSSGLLDISLYSSILPADPSEPIVPDSAIYTGTTLIQDTDEWQGVNLGITIDPGVYWVVFEANRDEDVSNEFNFYADIPSPLEAIADYSSQFPAGDGYSGWAIVSSGSCEPGYPSIPLRVYDEIAVVPLPPAIWLLVSGIITLAGISRNRIRKPG
jgi:hypothetical protein